MSLPDTTSAEAFDHYVSGKCLLNGRGAAWRDMQAHVAEFPHTVDTHHVPSVNESFLVWTLTGEAEFQEREKGGPWITHRVSKGAFFLTSGGDPYDCRWHTTSREPLRSLMVFISLPVLQRAFEEVFASRAGEARLADISAAHDPVLDALLEQVHAELQRKQASPLMVQSLAQMLAVHLARNYGVTSNSKGRRFSSAGLPGYKVRQLTEWMADHLDEELHLDDLDDLAARAGLSKFHFHRLFKSATGVAPSRYHLDLRMNAARRLLRETKQSVISIGMEVGYSNPSHFAQLFRRETGLSPSDYRRQP